MKSGFTSDSVRGNPDYFHWLWKASPNVDIHVKIIRSQISEMIPIPFYHGKTSTKF